MSFIKDIELSECIKSNLKKLGFEKATPVQERAIPLVLAGKDVAGLAQTGTGKTAAYLLPLIERVYSAKQQSGTAGYKNWKEKEFVLVLVPTRELTDQVFQSFKGLSEGTGLKGVAVFGGGPIEKQKEILSKGVDFVFATPGRLIDHYRSHTIDMNQVRAVVFDEADRMFDMGFKDDMKYLLRRIQRTRQFLLFSATLDFEVLNVAYEFEAEPIELNISRDQLQTDNVETELFHLSEEDKPKYLLSLLKKHNPRNVVIFTNYKNQVELISEFLKKNDIPAVGISSLLRQAQRKKVIEKIKSDGGVNILVGTDVAARGLDIKGVDLVINYDLPSHSEVYVHRIGRTGRADNKGLALSLSSEKDVEALARIEEFLGEKITVGWLDDSDIIEEYKSLDEVKKELYKKRKPSSQSSYRGKSGSKGKKKFGSKKSYQGKKKSGEDFRKKKKKTSPSGYKKSADGSREDFKKKKGSKRKRYSKKYSSKNSPRNTSKASSKKATGLGAKVKSFFKGIFS